MTAAILLALAHIHASYGPDGVSAWLNIPHVAAGGGFNWAGHGAGLYHFFQVQA